MRAFARVLLLAALALDATGCHTIRYHRRVPAEIEPKVSQWNHGMFGVVELSSAVPVEVLCPQGVARVENEETFLNGLARGAVQVVPLLGSLGVASANPGAGGGLLALFLGMPVWSPSTVRIYCRQTDGVAPVPATPPATPAAAAQLSTQQETKPAEPPKPAVPRKEKLAVLPLAARAGMDPGVADLFTDALVGELRRRPDVMVMGSSDIAALIGLEKQKQLVGCTDESCLQEIAGALGVDRVINGSVGRLGNSLVVNLTLLDTRKARAIGSVSERLKGSSDEVFLDALPRLVRQLMEPGR